MSETAPLPSREQQLADLRAKVLREVSPAFRSSASPQIADKDVQAGVDLLFQLLAHRVGDLELDAVGEEVVAGLRRWFHQGELVKLADRYEPFCKLVLQVINPSKYAQLQAETENRLSAAKVLKALDLVTNTTFGAFGLCAWEQFPPADVVGKANFLEHVARTYVFRNVDDHRAQVLNQREKAEVAESFCVFLVWCVIKFGQQIGGSLTTARFRAYLESVHSRFAAIGAKYVVLTTEARSPEEYRILDPLSTSPEAASSDEETNASKLAEVNRVTVIEAEPGAGKTTTLQFLAWQQAGGLLGGKMGYSHVPVYVELKLLSHRGQTIEVAVEQALKPANGGAEPIPWDSLLLLVDGVNEVAPQFQTNFKSELRELLSRFSKLRIVVAGRPNSFRGEFEARIVVLQKLTDKQLADLFRCALGDDGKAVALLSSVRHSQFLSSWARTPLHAAMVVAVAKRDGIDALSNHSTAVRRYVRGFLIREGIQAPGQTLLLTKERLLARLAFETKASGQLTLSKISALSTLKTAKDQIGAVSLDVPKFIQEVLDNHLLQQADNEALEFAHELYHDYFAATELEAQEKQKVGLGAAFALSHFQDASWTECIRLFAGITKSSSSLVESGAEKNPMLAWMLLQDAHLEEPHLNETVSLAAYSVFEGDLSLQGRTALAAACMPVLADLGRADLVEQAIYRQREILEPSGLWKLEKNARLEAEKRIRKAMVPLGYGLISILRLGTIEQRTGLESHYSDASRSAIRALKQIKAARVLVTILACWTGKTFEAASLMPGEVLGALLELGVDEVLDNEDESLNRVLAEWLRLASEAEFSKAWPAYGRVLRLATRNYVTGIDFDPNTALKWLRKSHDSGDGNGSLELALLLIEKPDLTNEAGEGERMLRQLAQTNHEARYELGLRLLEGEDLSKSEAEGFEHLLSLAESGHADALTEVCLYCVGQIVVGPPRRIILPTWAEPYHSRIKALNPNLPLGLS